MKRRFTLVWMLVVFTEALLIFYALMYLADHFGWHLVREAGGNVVSTASLPGDRYP